MKRVLIETLDRRKEMMIASLWSNSNYDDDKGSRKKAIAELEEHFDNAVKAIHSGPEPEEDLNDNPFFTKGTEGLNKIAPPPDMDGTVKEALDYSRDIDQ